MAAEATHIVLAEKVFNTYFSAKDKQIFIIGTTFPDIRYLGAINREKTHFEGVSIKDAQQESPFFAGLKFHSLVDEAGSRFFASCGAYNLLPDSPYTGQTIKLLADGVLYQKISDWEQVRGYFGKVVPEELGFGVPLESVQRWHKVLQDYLAAGLSDASIRAFVRGIGRPRIMAEEIIRIKHQIEGNEEIRSYIERFYEQF